MGRLHRESKGVYRCHRIHLALKRKGIARFEKAIRHMMKEEGLTAFVPKRAKFNT